MKRNKTECECRNLIYDNYPCYVCGFSSDGNNFALADDGGVVIIRRKGILSS